MDPITQQGLAGASGAGSDPLYVDDVFSTHLYEGAGSTQTVTNGIDLAGEGGMVWIKNRESSSYDHIIADTERGAYKILKPNLNSAESNNNGSVTAFNSDGFDLGVYTDVSANTSDFVSWTFRKAPGFFDVVTYTGNGANQQFISHNLGSVPGFIIVKRTSNTEDWTCYHRSLGNSSYIQLNGTGGQSSASHLWWNNNTPTATQFCVGSHDRVNTNGEQYVAYIFGHTDGTFYGENEDEAIIKCGYYYGSGGDGNIVSLGFEPQMLLIKNTNQSLNTNWLLVDHMRGMPVAGNQSLQAMPLYPNNNSAEAGNNAIEPLPTGFTPRGSGSYTNGNGSTYIYIAIRRPHKPPETATDVFHISSAVGVPRYQSPFVPDTIFQTAKSMSYNYFWHRLTIDRYMKTTSNASELSAGASWDWDFMNGVGPNLTSSDYFAYMFRRAPGFFDVVTYTGDANLGQYVSHNLGVVPEMIIVKPRSFGWDWQVHHKTYGSTGYFYLNQQDGFVSNPNTGFGSIAPTATQFFRKGSNDNANTQPYICLLFASLPGISKVGTYAGSSGNVDVDCGFTNGARFVLVKRADAVGQWYFWDSTRGIVSGNDPYSFMNLQQAEVTNTDYIDPLSSGFRITSGAISNINTAGGNYIFLAIA